MEGVRSTDVLVVILLIVLNKGAVRQPEFIIKIAHPNARYQSRLFVHLNVKFVDVSFSSLMTQQYRFQVSEGVSNKGHPFVRGCISSRGHDS